MLLEATLFLATLITFLLLLRFKSQMAALVAWIVGTITGARTTEENREEVKTTTNEPERSKSKKSKSKPKKSPTREPLFSTTLTTPIEEIIEETLNEEVKSSDGVDVKSANKPKKRNKSAKTKITSNLEEIETSSDSPTSSDPLGFSFLPVKERRKKNPKSKIDDLPKSSLIEHYQPKRSKKPLEHFQDEYVVIEKTPKPSESSKKPQENVIEIVNKESGKTVYLETKESKKVHAKISYASVASQRFEESLEQILKEESLKQKVTDEVNGISKVETEIKQEEFLEPEDLTEGIKEQIPDLEINKEVDNVNETKGNEELVNEIQSEARRLVDLLEEDLIETDDIVSNKNIPETQSNIEEFVSLTKTSHSLHSSPADSQKFIQEEIQPVAYGVNSTAEDKADDISYIREESLPVVYGREETETQDNEEVIAKEEPVEDRTPNSLVSEGVDTKESIEIITKQEAVEDKPVLNISVDLEKRNQIIQSATEEEILSNGTDEELKETLNVVTTADSGEHEFKVEEFTDKSSILQEEEQEIVRIEETKSEFNKESTEQVLIPEEVAEKKPEGEIDSEKQIHLFEFPDEEFCNIIFELQKEGQLNFEETEPEIKESIELLIQDAVAEESVEGEVESEKQSALLELEAEELGIKNSDFQKEKRIKEPEEITEDRAEGEVEIEKHIDLPALKVEEFCYRTSELQKQEQEFVQIKSNISKENIQVLLNPEEFIEESVEGEVYIEGQSDFVELEVEKFTSKISELQKKVQEFIEIEKTISEINRKSIEELLIPYEIIENSEAEVGVETTGLEKLPAEDISEQKDLDESIEVVKTEISNQEIESESVAENITDQNLSESLELVEDQISVVKTQEEKPFKMSSGTQVRVLTLNDKEHQDSTLYRLEKNWILQFRLGPSLLGRKVSLYSNYPKENEQYKRHSYTVLKWSKDEGCNYSDDTALLIEITVNISGSFHYYFTYEDGDKDAHQGSGFFLVDPVLSYGNNEKLPLDCIQCQTFLTKGLGPFDTWENKLKVAKESGYNMIHFTPIQELGASNSSYSLSEQLKVNPIFAKQNGEETTFDDVENLIKKLTTQWKVVSICDIVLNHTANESEWLKEHPEVTYNCQNCPYMRPSYLLDAAFHQFSIDVSKGLYEDKGIPTEVTTEEHLTAIRHYLHTDVLAKLKVHELFSCDVNQLVAEFSSQIRRNSTPTQENRNRDSEPELTLIQDPLYRRLSSTIDMKLAVKLYNVYRHDCFDEETRIKKCSEELKSKLDYLNKKVTDEFSDHLKSAVDNVIAGIRYFRVQHDGPKLKEISIKNPLVGRYFTDYGKPANIREHEEIMYSDKGRFLMTHNGWVMNSDPLRNFAAPGSNVYLRRELIAWSDSVKLRYGDKPEDCPFLWEYMKTYVEITARIFNGVRLDNCHSTPIPVAEYLLDAARKIKPDLYVVAELFTNSDMTDNIFVNRLGITSLIREAMSAWDSHEQGRLVHRYGGSPVGSFYQPRIRPLVPSIAHALFLDLTHDNPSPVEKRSVFDLIPSSALVNMACCASGSNRGYDELVPHHIHVVDETRQYTEWTDDDNLAMGNARYVTKKSGIIAAKKALNELHLHLGAKGFNQVYVDQMDPDVVAVTRHCPETHESYVLVAFTAFSHPPEDAANYQRGIRPLRIEGVLDEIVLEATLSHVGANIKYARSQNFCKDTKWINGLSEYQVHVKEHIQPENSEIFEKGNSGTASTIQLNFKNFKPGSVAVIKVSLPEDMSDAIKSVRKLISQFSFKKESEIWRVVSQLALPDLNRALYRCDQEERDEGHGFGTYDIPNFGPLVYAGFQGFMSLLSNVRPNNDLGHPMCGNLRDGNWMIEYIWQRLKLDEGTKPFGQWFEENTKSLKAIPRYLIPCYFDVIVTGIYIILLEHNHNLMSELVQKGSTFVKGLAMGSVQFSAYIKSADLPVLSPNLTEPKPPQRKNDKGENVQACVTLSAGLPHFSVGYTRNWGRDTFIALRGLFLLTGRYQDARYHILGYAACLRHGLIPNLLDGGRNSRFNCRDAIWWWLHCIKCYTEDAPNGLAILSDKVSRIFPTDDSPAQPPGTLDQPLHDVMQEALKVHFQGLLFRERNAGRQIDEHMTDAGFNNQIGIHPETGFVFGGNSSNCGTWMDKMGSSEKAGNKGKPATPRDGSAVELVGLSKAVVTWLDELSKKGVYPYKGVERKGKNGNVTKWSFKEWADKIQDNFEKYFWVNTTPVPGEIRPDLINKRGIYKDCYGASQEWTDFQLRCNFPIAMVVAPELFDPKRAWIALQQTEKYLLGPLGMKTLDPEDWAYDGYYVNSNDSNDPKVAQGFNYHQGPEWVWPVGFYLRAKLLFAAANGELAETVANTKVVLSKHFVELQTSTWRGLPELTNKDGAYCNDSSRTQAWSMSCILEVLYDLQKIEKTQPIIN